MRKERCANAALATVYRILHRFIMSVELSKNYIKKIKTYLYMILMKILSDKEFT